MLILETCDNTVLSRGALYFITRLYLIHILLLHLGGSHIFISSSLHEEFQHSLQK